MLFSLNNIVSLVYILSLLEMQLGENNKKKCIKICL